MGPYAARPGNGPPQQYGHPDNPARKGPRRFFPWLFLAIQVLFIVWIVVGINSNGSADASCEGLTGIDLRNCQDAGDAGTAIGVGLIIAFWAAVDIILGISYLMFRLLRRR